MAPRHHLMTTVGPLIGYDSRQANILQFTSTLPENSYCLKRGGYIFPVDCNKAIFICRLWKQLPCILQQSCGECRKPVAYKIA